MTRLPLQASVAAVPRSGDEVGDLPQTPVDELVAVEIRRSGGRPVVHVSGTLDDSGGPLLEAVVDHVGAVHGTPVLVDLSAVALADSHGIAPALRRTVEIVAASGPVRRLLHALGSPAQRAGAPVPRARRRPRPVPVRHT